MLNFKVKGLTRIWISKEPFSTKNWPQRGQNWKVTNMFRCAHQICTKLCKGQVAPLPLRMWPETWAGILPRSEKYFPVPELHASDALRRLPCRRHVSMSLFSCQTSLTLYYVKEWQSSTETEKSNLHFYFPEKSWRVRENSALRPKLVLGTRRPHARYSSAHDHVQNSDVKWQNLLSKRCCILDRLFRFWLRLKWNRSWTQRKMTFIYPEGSP